MSARLLTTLDHNKTHYASQRSHKESIYVGKSMSSIAKRIRQLRESMEMSRPEFARQLGIPPRTLETMENRATSPREAILKAVAEKYPEYCYWLLTGKVSLKVGQTKPKKTSTTAS